MRHGGWHLRFQRRFTVFKGVRLNVGRRGVGLSFGGRLARFGITARGKLHQSLSVPGTGLSMRRTMGSGTPAHHLQPRPLSVTPVQQRPRIITPMMIGQIVFLVALVVAALR